MSKHVLSVGQCVPDQAVISAMIEKNFDAKVATADLPAEALAKLAQTPFDLVLVNRKLDTDYSDGLNIIKQVKANPAIAMTPCILITNYPEYQAEAIAAGAEPGFGKYDCNQPAALDALRKHLR